MPPKCLTCHVHHERKQPCAPVADTSQPPAKDKLHIESADDVDFLRFLAGTTLITNTLPASGKKLLKIADSIEAARALAVPARQPQGDLKRVKQDVEMLRAQCHGTYNGGYNVEITHEAFHRGMDTVCNVLAGNDKDDGWLNRAIERLASPVASAVNFVSDFQMPSCAACGAITFAKCPECGMAAPVAQPPHVAWLRFKNEGDKATLHLCDSDAEGAFKVFRAKPPQTQLLDELTRAVMNEISKGTLTLSASGQDVLDRCLRETQYRPAIRTSAPAQIVDSVCESAAPVADQGQPVERRDGREWRTGDTERAGYIDADGDNLLHAERRAAQGQAQKNEDEECPLCGDYCDHNEAQQITIQKAFAAGARSGWFRALVFYVDIDAEGKPEYLAEAAERWPLSAPPPAACAPLEGEQECSVCDKPDSDLVHHHKLLSTYHKFQPALEGEQK